MNPRLYRSASKESVIVAAQRVTMATESLVKSAKGTAEEEKMVECARKVASATSELVSASGSFASPVYLQKLSEAAKVVAFATSQLVSVAKSVSDKRERSKSNFFDNDDDAYSSDEEENEKLTTEQRNKKKLEPKTDVKVKHYEQQVKIKKLEKELEKAIEDLTGMNKQEYKIY